MKTFVSVGNATQPFTRLLEAVSAIVTTLPQPVIIQNGHTPFSCSGCTAVQFMDMLEFSRTVESSELLIMHAGAGSIIHAIRAGKVPVIMPRSLMHGEHIDDHQLEFAKVLNDLGRVVTVTDTDKLQSAISRALAMQKAQEISLSSPNMVLLVEKRLKRIAELNAK